MNLAQGGVLGIMAYMGRLRPKRSTFFRLQVYERIGISQFEVCKTVGKSVVMGKNWVTFASIFSFRPQAPEKRPKKSQKNSKILSVSFKYRSIKSYFFKMYGWI